MEEIEKLRIQAEVEKLQLESKEIEKKLKSSVGTRRFLVEGVVGGIIAAALLAAWLIVYLKPIISAKSDLAEITSKIHEAKAKSLSEEKSRLEEVQRKIEKSKIEAEKQAQKLININSELLNQQEQSKAKISDQRRELERIASEVKRLTTTLGTSESEKVELRNLATKTQSEIARLSEVREKISANIDASMSRGEDLEKQRIKTILSPYTYWIQKQSGEEKGEKEIIATLARYGLDTNRMGDYGCKCNRTVKTEANVSETAIFELKKMFPGYKFITSIFSDGLVTIYP